MSKAGYFEYKKLQKEFSKAMQAGDINKAREISNRMNELTIG